MNRYLTLFLLAVFISVAYTNIFAQQAKPVNPPQATPPAQDANPLSTELKQLYTGVKNNLTRMAKKMPEEHYGFKATPEIRTFGQLIAHVAEAQTRNCSMVNGERKDIILPPRPRRPIWSPR